MTSEEHRACCGLLTPGRIIPFQQAVPVLGGTALAVIGASFIISRMIYSRAKKKLAVGQITQSLKVKQVFIGGLFAFLMGAGALAFGGLCQSVVRIAVSGITLVQRGNLLASGALSLVAFFSIYLIDGLDLASDGTRRRIGFLETAWRKENKE